MKAPTRDQAQLRARAVDAHRSGRRDEAMATYSAYLSQVPDDAGIWSNLGILLRTDQKHLMATRMQERAYALDPKGAGVANNLANIYSDTGRYEESLVLRRAILAAGDGDPNQKAMVGRCLRGLGRYDEAADWLRAAIKDHPDEAELQVQLAFALLGAQSYDEAFVHYRARWRTPELTPRQLPLPEWKGEDLQGKTVAVLTEQGYGDSVLFARFLPWIKARGARVIFVSEKPMLRLFERLEGPDLVTLGIPATERVDYWTNIMDLPLLGLNGVADIPPPTRLNVPKDSRDRARTFSAPFGDRFKVGVVWTGSATYKGNAFRSFSHTDFLPLTDLPGVQLFSLYKGPYLEAFQSDGSAALMVDTAATDRDFADCAGTMREMDLIITSDTATAHIAGSLGLPTWVVLHWDPFWVYRHSGDTTPWYPSMRLFRQQSPLDWSGVFAQVRAALVETAGKRRA